MVVVITVFLILLFIKLVSPSPSSPASWSTFTQSMGLTGLTLILPRVIMYMSASIRCSLSSGLDTSLFELMDAFDFDLVHVGPFLLERPSKWGSVLSHALWPRYVSFTTSHFLVRCCCGTTVLYRPTSWRASSSSPRGCAPHPSALFWPAPTPDSRMRTWNPPRAPCAFWLHSGSKK